MRQDAISNHLLIQHSDKNVRFYGTVTIKEIDSVNGSASVGKVDVEKYSSLSARYNIRNIPTMVLFRNGKEIDRFVGAKSKDFLIKQILKAN